MTVADESKHVCNAIRLERSALSPKDNRVKPIIVVISCTVQGWCSFSIKGHLSRTMIRGEPVR